MIEHSTLTINNTTFEYSIKAYEEPSEAETIRAKDNE